MRFCYVSGGIARGFFLFSGCQANELRCVKFRDIPCSVTSFSQLCRSEMKSVAVSVLNLSLNHETYGFYFPFLSFFLSFVRSCREILWTGCRIVPDYSGERTRTDSSQRPTGHTRPDEFQSLDGFHPIRIGRYGRQREPLHGSGRSLIQTHRTDARPLRGLQLPARVVHSAFRRRPVFIIFFFFTFFEINKQLRKERIFVVGN